MAFSTLTFVFLFLPICCLAYFLVPVKLKPYFMLLASLLFYAWSGLHNLLILLAVIAFNYLAAAQLYRLQKTNEDRFDPTGLRSKKTLLKISMFTTCGANVLVLGLFKYTSLMMPLGVSFFLFSAISYIVDIYRQDEIPETNPLYFALYLSFFPKVSSGPIVRYSIMREQLKRPILSRENLRKGVTLFLTGLSKKVLLADSFSAAFASVNAAPHPTVVSTWLGLIFYGLQLYFDFSGYTDMAIGLTRIFGFSSSENFNYPYLSTSLSDFWRRWHITLGAWFRDYIYIPLGGSRCSKLLNLRNLMAVWLLTGIWHGSTWNYVIWGVYNGLIIILDKFVLSKTLPKAPKALQILLTDLAVFVGWIFFFTPTFSEALRYMGHLIGIGTNGFFTASTFFFLKQNVVLLILGILCAGPAMKTMTTHLFTAKKHSFGPTLGTVCYALLLIVCVAFMVSSTYSTFLYFQF